MEVFAEPHGHGTGSHTRDLTFGGGYHEVNAKYIQTNPRNHCPELILPNGKCRKKSGIEDRQTCQVTVLKHHVNVFLLFTVNETISV